MLKLLTIPDISMLEKYEKLANEYNIGFEYNDFFNPAILDDNAELEKRISVYSKYSNNYNTMHGVFFDIILNSYDDKVAQIAKDRIIESVQIAKRLNCKKVVFHTNLDPSLNFESYLSRWLEKNTEFYKKLALDNPDITILIENMFDKTPEYLLKLVEAINMPNVRVCLDIAHAYISGTPIDIWIGLLHKYISHIHINDNNGDSDSHLAVGDGSIPYENYIEWLNNNDFTVLIEVKSYEAFVKSLKYLEKAGLKYGI